MFGARSSLPVLSASCSQRRDRADRKATTLTPTGRRRTRLCSSCDFQGASFIVTGQRVLVSVAPIRPLQLGGVGGFAIESDGALVTAFRGDRPGTRSHHE